MKRKVLSALCLLCALCALTAKAQTGKLFNADNLLSSSFTTQLFLDRDGFLWIATRNGLNRYDGYQSLIIKKDRQQLNGMASNYVNCITQAQDGLFYVGMYGALQTYDGSRFEDVEVKDLDGNTVRCYMTCFLVRRNGEILAGTSGHGLLTIQDRQHARQAGGQLKDIHTVQDLLEDRRGNVWVATSRKGLLEYDGRHVRSHFTAPEQLGTLRRMCEDQAGNIYVGTSMNGVYVRRAGSSEFQHIEATSHKHIAALYCQRNGHVMIGYDGQGLAIYDPQTGSVTDNPYFSSEVDLSRSKIYSIAEDGSGNIWLGMLQKGVYMQPGKERGFFYMGYKLGQNNVIGQACVISTMIDSKGRCWVGTDKDGLYVLDPDQHPIRHFKDAFPASIMSIAEDGEGRIWVGSWAEGFGYIDANATAYHQFPQYLQTNALDIEAPHGGDLWVATMGQGLLRIDLNTLQVKTAYTMKEGAPDHPQMNSITNDYISKISLSPDEKRIYLATTMGVCCLDIDKDSWTSAFGRNCLNYGTPCRIVKEYDGKLWIGTNDGLYWTEVNDNVNVNENDAQRSAPNTQHPTPNTQHPTPNTQHPTPKPLSAPLSENGIASIEQDKEGRLWISTDHGLCCYDPKTDLTRTFFVDNGLQSNEFSDGASWAVDRGTRVVMLFGGVGGITYFRPEEIQQAKWDAKVTLVAFAINNKRVNSDTYSDGYQVCDTTAIAADRFELAHHDNTFAIQFSTLTYDNPEHITYLYRINGEDFSRLQPGINEITLTHLPPGTYHFCVKAERNGIQTAERCFTVVIHAPWYRSTVAYIIYVLLLLGAVWLYLAYRRRKEQDRLRLQEHIHAEEMADAKLRFFMNISHEIRTPMTLIVTPLLSLIKQDDDPQRRSIYETIRRNAERILGLINQMMDLRKIDKGQMQMRMCETDIIGFVGDIHTLFEQQARVKNIQFAYEHDAKELPVWIDRGNFDKVIVNILSNAFKFTPPGGIIRILLTHDDQQVRIAIYDNGETIPEDKLDRIFERFYQSATSVNDRNVGTGIGLDLTRSLVELHHGTIQAHNNADGHGCEFVVTIPLGKEHLKESEIAEVATAPSNLPLLEAAPSNLPPLGEASPSKRQRIVIVEDDSEIRDFLADELQGDYDVATCTNGREGLAEVLRSLPDLVISDIMMPEMDGNTLCSKIKSSPTTSHIPVVLLTAKSRDEDQLEGLETGADAYIMKPFNMDILRQTIMNLINTHRMLRLKYSRNDLLEEKVERIDMKSPDDKLLERVMVVINKNISNSDLSVDSIAEEVGISRVHLHRKMKELTGQTPHDFIRNIRLKRAAHLLANNNMNIAEVMYACGFNNSASFSTIFKRFYGLSPRDYMKEHGDR